jgi:hypothetical protein
MGTERATPVGAGEGRRREALDLATFGEEDRTPVSGNRSGKERGGMRAGWTAMVGAAFLQAVLPTIVRAQIAVARDDGIVAPDEALSVDEVVPRLSAPDPAVRLAAIQWLGELHDRAAVTDLMTVLRQDPDPEVRRAAAIALGAIRDASATAALQESAQSDPDLEVRAAARDGVEALSPAPADVSAPPPQSNDIEWREVGPTGQQSAPIDATLSRAAAGPVTVIEDSGTAVEAGAGTTELVLESEEPGLPVSRVMMTGSVVSSTGHRATMSASELVCRTPCRVQLAGGSYTLLAGNYEFEVQAVGGTQRWMLEEENSAGYWSGFALAAVGVVMLISGAAIASTGALTLGDSDIYLELGLGLVGGGVAGLAIGLPLSFLSLGDAELEEDSATAAAVRSSGSAVGSWRSPRWALLPGLVGVDPASGATSWGFQFRLAL